MDMTFSLSFTLNYRLKKESAIYSKMNLHERVMLTNQNPMFDGIHESWAVNTEDTVVVYEIFLKKKNKVMH